MIYQLRSRLKTAGVIIRNLIKNLSYRSAGAEQGAVALFRALIPWCDASGATEVSLFDHRDRHFDASSYTFAKIRHGG
jgi:hypothetical protein